MNVFKRRDAGQPLLTSRGHENKWPGTRFLRNRQWLSDRGWKYYLDSCCVAMRNAPANSILKTTL